MHQKSTLRLGLLLLLGFTVANSALAARRAKNVILFLGDAGGLPTLNAAGIYAHDKPQSLFLHSMPHIGLSDTSALDAWVTDSAAGMTAIVTGHKTNNRMLSVVPDANGGPAQAVKTVLEYAEEKGLSTGVVTNMAAWDATPAACYSHVDSRAATAEIFAQFLKPRFGDGVDILIGKDRKGLNEAYAKQNLQPADVFQKAGYKLLDTPTDLMGTDRRAVAIYDGPDFEPIPVVDQVIDSLSANRKGYFLMVEWDAHTDDVKRGLNRLLKLDELIRHVAGRVGNDTLIVFAADHSFGLRMRGGKRNAPYAEQFDAASAKDGVKPQNNPVLMVENTHTGEEIVVAAKGPGAELVRGFMPNTRIFSVMMQAYGWKESP